MKEEKKVRMELVVAIVAIMISVIAVIAVIVVIQEVEKVDKKLYMFEKVTIEAENEFLSEIFDINEDVEDLKQEDMDYIRFGNSLQETEYTEIAKNECFRIYEKGDNGYLYIQTIDRHLVVVKGTFVEFVGSLQSKNMNGIRYTDNGDHLIYLNPKKPYGIDLNGNEGTIEY